MTKWELLLEWLDLIGATPSEVMAAVLNYREEIFNDYETRIREAPDAIQVRSATPEVPSAGGGGEDEPRDPGQVGERNAWEKVISEGYLGTLGTLGRGFKSKKL